MPYQVVERVKNNSDILLSSNEEFAEYLLGGRRISDQCERVRLAGLAIGLSDSVCNDIKAEIDLIYNNSSLLSFSDLDITTQEITRTTVFPSKEFSDNITLIRNSLVLPGTTIGLTLISEGEV